MTTILRLGIGVLLVAGLALAASPAISVSGDYVEARTADVYTGACFANSEVQLVGNLAVFGWKINKGTWNGVSLDGLSVAAAVKANSTLGSEGEVYPVKSVLIVDERASLEQRQALKAFAQRMTGDLLQDIVRTESMPIAFQFEGDSIHAARVTMTAGTLAASRPAPSAMATMPAATRSPGISRCPRPTTPWRLSPLRTALTARA